MSSSPAVGDVVARLRLAAEYAYITHYFRAPGLYMMLQYLIHYRDCVKVTFDILIKYLPRLAIGTWRIQINRLVSLN